jgi:predicted RNA-binding Zn-ribbon protein involved in translation (DUF1610 family)
MKCTSCGNELTTGDAPDSFYCRSCSMKEKKWYFTCLTCNGTKRVSRPPYIAGDIKTWTSASTESYECQTCEGKGVIWR